MSKDQKDQRALGEEKFSEGYKKLNKEQKEAVDCIEGVVMVLAGPGTGKTQILTLRIANILRKTDTAPEQILAITFTEAGVYAMRKRLNEMIGQASYKVNINTFHGFCNSLIARFPENFPRIVGRTPLNDVEQFRIVEKILAEKEFEHIKPYGDPTYYVRHLLSSIKDLKRENISPEEASKRLLSEEQVFENLPNKVHEKGAHKGKMKGEFELRAKQLKRDKEMIEVYEAYEKNLAEGKVFDYEDMILEVLRSLENDESFLRIIQEEYQYILADEHQDSNAAQNRLLELLSNFHDNPNLFIVGDEKQAIYRFQGASRENFLYFKKKYPQAKVVSLIDNYRSVQDILDASGSLIDNSSTAFGEVSGETKLKSNRKFDDEAGSGVVLLSFNSEENELKYVAQSIKKHLSLGAKGEEIAVLFRSNKEAFPLATMLSRYGVPYSIESDQDVLRDIDIQKFILLLRSINDLGNEKYLAEILFFDFLKLKTLDVFKLIGFARKERKVLSDVLSNEIILGAIGLEDSKTVFELFGRLKTLSELSKNKLLSESFETIARESQFLLHIISTPYSLDLLHKVDALFNLMRDVVSNKRDARLSDFITHLDTLLDYNVAIKTSPLLPRVGSVRLMTAHKSKGQEFELVYITGAYEGNWGHKTTREYFTLKGGGTRNDDTDERKLFYVALTRAKRQVVLTYSKLSKTGERLPSHFIDDIDANKIKIPDTKEIEEKLNAEKPAHFLPIENKGVSLTDREYLKELFLNRPLAVTALNNYLECPWKYFFVNLIRLPQEQTKSQLYGVAVHDCLRSTFERLKSGEMPTRESFLQSFFQSLNRQPLTMPDLEESRKKGEKALSGYFEEYHNSWLPNSLTEVSVTGVPFSIDDATEITLTGALDRIDFIDSSNNVRVIDYKTSKPKSRNEIEGNTKTSLGNEKRQLVFYQVLIDRYFADKYKMVEGVIDFIEPDQRGNYKKEVFAISKEEVAELEETIKKATKEILALDFWNKSCEDKDCEYCHLREMID